MAETDLLALCSAEVRSEFDALFRFARKEGVVAEADRAYYARRFASDAYSLRRDIEMRVAGKLSNSSLLFDVSTVRAMPGYPKPKVPSDPTAYPKHWLPSR